METSDRQLKEMNMEYMKHIKIARLTKTNKWLLAFIIVLAVVACIEGYLLYKDNLERLSGNFPHKTKLDSWNPFEEFQKMQREMDLFFKEKHPDFDSALLGMQSFSFGGPFPQEYKLAEDRQSYIITLSLPGLDQSNLNVSVEDQTLKISGRVQWQKESKRGDGALQKAYHSHVERYMTLPGLVEPESLEVSYKDDTLTVRIRKK